MRAIQRRTSAPTFFRLARLVAALALGASTLLHTFAQHGSRATDELPPAGQPRGGVGLADRPLPRGLRRAARRRRVDDPDLIRARIAFQLLQQRDENGEIPADAVPRAVRQMNSLRARASRLRVAGVPVEEPAGEPGRRLFPRTAGLAANRWVSIGPGNVGGRIRSIVFHPTRPQTMWVGSVGGGVWRSDNGGQTFAPVDDLMANLVVSTMVIDPANPNTVYAGTGERFDDSDEVALRGGGLFRTTDGRRWQRIAATAGEDFQYVTRLAISPDGATLLAATRAGLFLSADRERQTWRRASLDVGGRPAPFDGESVVADVDFHPTDPTKAVAGGAWNGRVYYSTDGGRTWKSAAHNSTCAARCRVEVTYARANPSIVYASADANGGEVWKSEDGGRTYRVMKTLALLGGRERYMEIATDVSQGSYDNVIWAGDPSNANFILVGGIDLWKSNDGGDTLTDVSRWYEPASAHSDQHAIVAHPGFNGTTNRTVFFGNDGGLYKTDNVYTVGAGPRRSRGWTKTGGGLGVTQFYGGAVNVSTGVIVGGAQDNGTLLYTPQAGADGWRAFFGGDGGWCAADPTDPKRFYGEYVFLDILRNTDGGLTKNDDSSISGQFWNETRGGWDWKDFPFHIPDARDSRALFIAPFVLDPNDPNRILGGGLSLWRTNEARAQVTPASGPRWSQIKPPIPAPRPLYGHLISAVAVAGGRPDVVWVGHVNGAIYRTTNATAAAPAWERVSNAQTPARYCMRITLDPLDPQTAYATFGGFKRGNVWKTADGGRTWRDIGQTLPEAPVRALAVHPRNPRLLYAGTEVGLFASEDGGATWSPTNEGPTNCAVYDLFWSGDTLIAATYGRGMFKINLP